MVELVLHPCTFNMSTKTTLLLVTLPLTLLGSAMSFSILYYERHPPPAEIFSEKSSPCTVRQVAWLRSRLGLPEPRDDCSSTPQPAHVFRIHPTEQHITFVGGPRGSLTVLPHTCVPADTDLVASTNADLIVTATTTIASVGTGLMGHNSLPTNASSAIQCPAELHPKPVPSRVAAWDAALRDDPALVARNATVAATGQLASFTPVERDFCLSRLAVALSQNTQREAAQLMSAAFALTATVTLPVVFRMHRRLGSRPVALLSFLPMQALYAAYAYRLHADFDAHITLLEQHRSVSTLWGGYSLAHAERLSNLHRRTQALASSWWSPASLSRWTITECGDCLVEWPLTSTKHAKFKAAATRLDGAGENSVADVTVIKPVA